VSLQTAQESNRVVALYAMALIGAHLGNVEEARAAATEGLAAAERGGGVIRAMQNLSTLGFLELSLRNLPEAHRHLARAEELRLDAPMRDPGAVRFVHNLIETLIGLGRLGEATEVLGRWEALCGSLGRGSAIALAARCRALLLASTGEIDAAISELSGVLEPADKLPMPFERARTLLMLGEARRRAKQKRLSRDALREALGIFEGLGARLWAARTREEIDRLGKRAENPWDLTPTEAQIAELVASGRTNRQVADQMFLAEKTVAANLSRIYLKMGVRSRMEMAKELRASFPTKDA